MRTVIEFLAFVRLADGRVSDAERKAIVDHVAAQPGAGDLIPCGWRA